MEMKSLLPEIRLMISMKEKNNTERSESFTESLIKPLDEKNYLKNKKSTIGL